MAIWDSLILVARVCQFLFSIIVLGLTAHVATVWNNTNDYYYGYTVSLSQNSFLLFVSVWSLLVVGFQILVPRYSEALGHKFVIFGLDLLTALFWFAGFIAEAVLFSPNAYLSGSDFYRSGQAAAAIGAFAWLSFLVTSVLTGLSIFRGNTGSAKHHNPEISHPVV